MATARKHGRCRVVEARSALFEIEPELITAERLLFASRILGEAEDHIKPAAIGAVDHCGPEALDRATASWRGAMEDVEAE